MNTYEKYLEFCDKHKDPKDFFSSLAEEFNVPYLIGFDLWYASQRGWFKPEMADAILALASEEFHPNFAAGEVSWDEENKKFINTR